MSNEPVLCPDCGDCFLSRTSDGALVCPSYACGYHAGG